MQEQLNLEPTEFVGQPGLQPVLEHALDFTLEQLFHPEIFMPTVSTNDSEGLANVEQFSPKSILDIIISGCASDHGIGPPSPESLLLSPPCISPSPCSDSSFGSSGIIHSTEPNPWNDRSPETILHWYGSGRKSPQEIQQESLRYDQALLEEYIQSDSKLTAQVAFFKRQRMKKQTDSNLVHHYRFVVSLYGMLKTVKLKEAHQVSSKAILACLGVNSSYLCKARQVVKLLNKIGPDGTSPDPLVIQRLQSTATIKKGSDILTFLKRQLLAQPNDDTFECQ